MNELNCLELKSVEYNFTKLGSLILLVTNVNRMLKDGLECYEKQHMEDFKGYVDLSISNLDVFYDFYCEVEGKILKDIKLIKDKNCGGVK